jgi:hypothetical protein
MAWKPSASRIGVQPTPKIPALLGSATLRLHQVDAAASIASPPIARISRVAAKPREWLDAPTPYALVTGVFSGSNRAPSVARQLEGGTAVGLPHNRSGWQASSPDKARERNSVFWTTSLGRMTETMG